MQFKQNTWVIPYDMTLAVVRGQGGVKGEWGAQGPRGLGERGDPKWDRKGWLWGGRRAYL